MVREVVFDLYRSDVGGIRHPESEEPVLQQEAEKTESLTSTTSYWCGPRSSTAYAPGTESNVLLPI